jgi:hypothetical protein
MHEVELPGLSKQLTPVPNSRIRCKEAASLSAAKSTSLQILWQLKQAEGTFSP